MPIQRKPKKSIIVIHSIDGQKLTMISPTPLKEVSENYHNAMAIDGKKGVWSIEDSETGAAPIQGEPLIVISNEFKYFPVSSILYWYGADLEAQSIISSPTDITDIARNRKIQ